jgi:hypothetical protein
VNFNRRLAVWRVRTQVVSRAFCNFRHGMWVFLKDGFRTVLLAVNCFYLKEVERIYGDHAYFVVVIRHGLDVVCSLQEFTQKTAGLHQRAPRLRRALPEAARGFRPRLGGRDQRSAGVRGAPAERPPRPVRGSGEQARDKAAQATAQSHATRGGASSRAPLPREAGERLHSGRASDKPLIRECRPLPCSASDAGLVRRSAFPALPCAAASRSAHRRCSGGN